MITITLAHDKDCDRKHFNVRCAHGGFLACLPRAPKKDADREPYHDPHHQQLEMAARLRERTGCSCRLTEREAAA